MACWLSRLWGLDGRDNDRVAICPYVRQELQVIQFVQEGARPIIEHILSSPFAPQRSGQHGLDSGKDDLVHRQGNFAGLRDQVQQIHGMHPKVSVVAEHGMLL